MLTLKCIDCGNEFEAKRKDTQRCKPCKAKRRSLIVMISRQKRIPETEIGVGSGNSKGNQIGPNNHSWKTGIQGYRKLIDKKECAYCKSTKYLVIHHKDENRHNNNTDNLIVLCKSCHQKYHVKRNPINGKFVSRLQTNTEESN